MTTKWPLISQVVVTIYVFIEKPGLFPLRNYPEPRRPNIGQFAQNFLLRLRPIRYGRLLADLGRLFTLGRKPDHPLGFQAPQQFHAGIHLVAACSGMPPQMLAHGLGQFAPTQTPKCLNRLPNLFKLLGPYLPTTLDYHGAPPFKRSVLIYLVPPNNPHATFIKRFLPCL
jgi:hypothetical protein